MSLSETQEMMRVLQEIMQKLEQVSSQTQKLNNDLPRTQKNIETYRDLERLALRYLTLARRMGLPDQIEQATQIVSSLVVMFRMLDISLTMMSGGGLKALIGIAGVIGVIFTANDMLGYDSMRGNY